MQTAGLNDPLQVTSAQFEMNLSHDKEITTIGCMMKNYRLRHPTSPECRVDQENPPFWWAPEPKKCSTVSTNPITTEAISYSENKDIAAIDQIMFAEIQSMKLQLPHDTTAPRYCWKIIFNL